MSFTFTITTACRLPFAVDYNDRVTVGMDGTVAPKSIGGVPVGGLTVPLTFTAGKPHPVDCWFTARVQGGTPKLIDNGKVTCVGGKSA